MNLLATTYGAAVFSDDLRYRYSLTRNTGPGFRTFVGIGLNPSTADEKDPDPTITRMMGFAKREGCGSLLMLNLFAYRDKDPKVLARVADPIGPHNYDQIRAELQALVDGDQGITAVAAWGADKAVTDDAEHCMERLFHDMGIPLLCFGLTKHGYPRHPLYLRSDTPLVPYDFHPEY